MQILALALLQLILGASGLAGWLRATGGWPRGADGHGSPRWPRGFPGKQAWRGFAGGLALGPLLALGQAATTFAVVGLAQLVDGSGAVLELARREEAAIASLLMAATPAWAALLVALVLVGAPLAEELFFRGYFYGLLRRQGGVAPFTAAALSAAAFAALHGYAVHFPALWISGVLLAYWYERRRQLSVPVGAHVSLNVITLALSFLGPVARIT